MTIFLTILATIYFIGIIITGIGAFMAVSKDDEIQNTYSKVDKSGIYVIMIGMAMAWPVTWIFIIKHRKEIF